MVQEGGWKRAPPEGPVATSVDEDEEQRHLGKREENIFMKRRLLQFMIKQNLAMIQSFLSEQSTSLPVLYLPSPHEVLIKDG